MPISIDRVDEYAKVGVNGGGFVGPVDTPAPTDGIDTAPTDPWLPIGRISDDGLELGFDEDSESFTGWGEAAPFRTVTTSSTRTLVFTAWETDRPIVRSLMYRVPVADLEPDDDTKEVSWADSALVAPDRRAFLFYVIDGSNIERLYVPNGEVTERDNVTYKSDTVVGFQFTVSAYPDENGKTVYHVSKGFVPAP